MRRLITTGIALAGCLILAAAAPVVAAECPDPPAGQQQAAQTGQGPLVLEPIRSGLVIAPEARVTEIDGRTRTLVGAYGGWLKEDALLLGGGGYWLADHSRNRSMAYAGFVIGWSLPVGRTVRFGARALVGGGEATLGRTVTFAVPAGFDHSGQGPWSDHDGNTTTTTTRQVGVRQQFLVAEPQVDFVVYVTRWMALDGGVGYRAIARADGYEHQLRGVVGSFAVRFGGGR